MSVNVANGPQGADWAPRPQPPLGGLVLQIAGVVCLALLLALSGAFDTDHLDLARRTILWLVISALIVAQPCLIDTALRRAAPLGLVYRALSWGVTVALTIVLMAIELHALKMTPLPPDDWAHDAFLDLIAFIWPTVAVVAGLVVLLHRQRWRVQERAHPAELPPASGTAPQDPADWPDEPVVWVRVHDHYLEVATASRTHLLRGRMRDAVMRLGRAPGLQVHRSWWVAKDAVVSVRREGREHVLVLKDGVRAPIGRSRTDAIRAQGWL